MTLDADRLLGWTGTRETEITADAAILYALGIGLGSDPVDKAELAFLDERALSVLPTMAMVLGVRPDYLTDPAYGVDLKKMLHGESGLVLHRPLPAGGRVRATARIDSILDRGPDKGAATYFSNAIHDAATGALIAETSGCFIMRGNGGFGGPSGPAPAPHKVPERAPDLSCEMPTLPQAGLIYRLSGDRNPLHIDPDLARKVGFERPILHGLAGFGLAGHAVLRLLCGGDPARFRALRLRYAAPVYPGETIRVDLFREAPGRYALRCTAIERGIVVLNNGYVEILE